MESGMNILQIQEELRKIGDAISSGELKVEKINLFLI